LGYFYFSSILILQGEQISTIGVSASFLFQPVFFHLLLFI